MVSFVIQWTLFYIFKNSSLRKGTQTAQKNLRTLEARRSEKEASGTESNGRIGSAERLYRALWGVKLRVRLKKNKEDTENVMWKRQAATPNARYH